MKQGDFIWAIVLCVISALLIVPVTHEVFIQMTAAHPYIMAFIKFLILATMGELLAIRIVSGAWKKPAGMIYKSFIWGIIGMLVALMFQVFSNGVAGAAKAGMLFVGEGFLSLLLGAFYTSAFMNLTFGPMFSAAHRVSDTYIDMRETDKAAPALAEVLVHIDWQAFINFIVLKIQPFFWIPAHTIVFMLPPEYRVLAAAYLSIALGVLLSYARRRQTA
ncbi:MAG: conserved rane protein of unknown function [Firmicutes bacterium]|nr:conserved rane protein of unknown function [Bacillota bacterium]